jgi:cytochrome c1
MKRAHTHIAWAAAAGIAIGGASALAIAQAQVPGQAPQPQIAPQPAATPGPAPAPATASAPATSPAGSPAAPAQEPVGTAAPAQPSTEGTAGAAPAPAPAAEAPAAPASAPAAAAAPPGPPPDTTAHHPKDTEFSFEGPFGTFDRAALQRGFQVYKEVCSVCHGLNLVAFHNLSEPGGPEFSEAQIKALAASFQVPKSAEDDEQGRTHDDSGQRIMRAGVPADYFPWKFENEKAARAANNGSLPPDLSVMAKAREGGPAYIYSILTGYGTAPANEPMGENMNYNPYFPGHQIAMPPPLTDGVVTYADGTKASVDQMAHDVATFLMWTAEPKMEERKRIGFGVMFFLIALSTLLYLTTYRKVWHGKHDVDVT